MQALVSMVALASCQSRLARLPMGWLPMCQGGAGHQVLRSHQVTLRRQARPPLHAVASWTPLHGLVRSLLQHRDHRRDQGSAVVPARPLQLPARRDLHASVLAGHSRTQHRGCHGGPRKHRGCSLQLPAGKRLRTGGRGGVSLRMFARLLHPPPKKRNPPKARGSLAHGHASASLYSSFTLRALGKQSPHPTPLSLQQRERLPSRAAPQSSPASAGK